MTVVGDGLQTRDFTHVKDVVRANIAATKCTSGFGEVFNIGTGTQISVLDLVNILGGDYIHIPDRLGECRFTEADITKAQTILEWEPQITLTDWLKDK